MTAIGIIGARKYKDRQSVIDLVDTLPADCVVITSSCRGVCTWAGEEAKVRRRETVMMALRTDTGPSSGRSRV